MKGILFTIDNHKAVRELRKSQTRRLDGLKEINKEPNAWECTGNKSNWLASHKTSWGFTGKHDNRYLSVKPRYKPNEPAYIKEAWVISNHSIDYPNKLEVLYKTKHDDNNDRQWVDVPFDTWVKYAYKNKWRSPLFMPVWAARDFITITDVRPERLQDISSHDIQAEGCPIDIDRIDKAREVYDMELAIEWFRVLWNSINKNCPWELNPFVWRYEFKLKKTK